MIGVNKHIDNFYRQVLPNGLKVIFEKRDSPAVSILASTNFGHFHEDKSLKGIAHLTEHVLFKRTKTLSFEQLTSAIEKKGGEIDAFTSEELTGFHTKLKAENFELGIDILSDIMMNPAFNKKDIDVEKKITMEEIKMHRDLPRSRVLDLLNEQLYAPPAGLPETVEDIKKLTKYSLQKYHNIHYIPSNMVVSIVGKAEVDKIWNSSKRDFMKKQVQKQIDKKSKAVIAKGPFGNVVEVKNGLEQAHVTLGYFMPTMKDKLRYAAEVMNVILGVGFSSKLSQEIREKKGLAYEVHSALHQGINYSHGYIYLGTSKAKYKSATKLALSELKKLQEVTQKDVDDAKEQLIGNYILEDEDSEKVAERLLEEELNGDGKEYYKYLEKMNGVTLDDVRKVAQIKEVASASLLPE